MSLIIKKIGGSLLKSDKDFNTIAAYLAEIYPKEPRMIVVVSALHGKTDQLIREAEALSLTPCYARELLLSLGEQKSCALLGLALEALRIPYTIFSGTHVGLSKGQNGDYEVDKIAYETIYHHLYGSFLLSSLIPLGAFSQILPHAFAKNPA